MKAVQLNFISIYLSLRLGCKTFLCLDWTWQTLLHENHFPSPELRSISLICLWVAFVGQTGEVLLSYYLRLLWFKSPPSHSSNGILWLKIKFFYVLKINIATVIDAVAVMSCKINAGNPQWICNCFSVLFSQWFLLFSFPGRNFAHIKWVRLKIHFHRRVIILEIVSLAIFLKDVANNRKICSL